MNRLAAWSPQLLSLLRIVSGLLFLEHGLMKILHFPAAQPGAPNPLPPILLAAGLIELVGGALVTAGLFTRLAAFIVSGEMAAAYFLGHATHGPFPALNGGDAAILYCFIFFYLVFAGPGPLSLDAMMRRRGR